MCRNRRTLIVFRERVPGDIVMSVDVAPSAAVFHARGLTKIYSAGEVPVKAIQDLDLDIAAGEFIVLLWPSDSGKSTLLNILGGLNTPTSGTLSFGDHQLSGASESELTAYRREHVGFVFQFYNLIPSLTVRENVALVTDIAEHPMQIDEAIDRVGLTPRRDHFPSQLSGGEQQRVAIARAISAPATSHSSSANANRRCLTASSSCHAWPAPSAKRRCCAIWRRSARAMCAS